MVRKDGFNTALKITFIVFVVALSFGLWLYFRIFQLFNSENPIILIPAVAYGTLVFVYLPMRVILYSLYKPYEDKGYRPSITIVVPAYNEGKFVKKTLMSLIKADYPRHLKQIICIDDGSKDDTYKHIMDIKNRFPSYLEVIKFPKNMGKREAMAAGVAQAKGEYVVFVDSDTSVYKNALKYIVAPFENPEVGGVTGRVAVFNKYTNFLTRMLGVRYVMSFDFYRCTRSVFGGVQCLSGIIAAYRKDFLDEVIPSWLDQWFLGQKCTYGDDRSLSNYVIKAGYKTVYSRKAIVSTIVPETLPKFLKMLARWNRSFIREGIVMGKFLIKPKNFVKRKMLTFDFFLSVFLAIFIEFVVIFMTYRVITEPLVFFRFIISITAISFIYMIFYIRSEKSWHFVFGIVYAFFYMFFLVWVLPYAGLTLKRVSWGTR